MQIHRTATRGESGSHVLTLGAFDGVHRIHRALLKALRDHGVEQSLSVGIGLYEGVVANDRNRLTSLDDRLAMLESTGFVDDVWMFPDTFHEHPRSHVTAWLSEVQPVAVTAPQGFTVGSGPVSLDADSLRDIATSRGWRFVDVEERLPGNPDTRRLYTTDHIRHLLQEGRLRIAGRLLGRLYEMHGIVRMGDQRGRKLGFPTANIHVDHRLIIPGDGVWAGVAITEVDTAHEAAVSLGRRQTFYDDGTLVLEAHLLDFDDDLYGEDLRVLFVDHLRSQQKFNGPDHLVQQLRIDIATVRELQPLSTWTESKNW